MTTRKTMVNTGSSYPSAISRKTAVTYKTAKVEKGLIAVRFEVSVTPGLEEMKGGANPCQCPLRFRRLFQGTPGTGPDLEGRERLLNLYERITGGFLPTPQLFSYVV